MSLLKGTYESGVACNDGLLLIAVLCYVYSLAPLGLVKNAVPTNVVVWPCLLGMPCLKLWSL